MDTADTDIEQTLHVARSVSLYRIPPRGPTGHVSGEWRLTDKLFEGRLRVVSTRGDQCDIRYEDVNTGDLFAASPIPYGKRGMYVEAAIDSSRNYVIRVEDAGTKQHAFLGMGFSDRSDAFDFNEALMRHEKHVERERAAIALSGGSAPPSSSSPGSAGQPGGHGAAPKASAAEQAVMKDMQTLYANHEDYTLKEGQTIKVNITKRTQKPGGLMSSAAAAAPGGFSLSIPPPPGAGPTLGAPLPPPTALAAPRLAPPPSQSNVPNLLDL